MDDIDVGFAVVPLVRAVDTVVLQPLNVRLSIAQNTTLEDDRLTDLHRRIARPLVDDRLVRVYSYETVYSRIRDNKKAQLSLTNPRDACEKFARFT